MKRKWETKYTLSEFNRKKHQERVRKIQELWIIRHGYDKNRSQSNLICYT
jgi:predicted fused transcriptional regulator/phosphomethylpyrimidine kinase